MSSSVLRTACDTTSPFAPACWYTAMNVAGWLLSRLSTMYCRRPDLGARDVAEAHDRAAVLVGAQDDPLVLLRVGGGPLGDHREGELDRAGVRLLPDLAGAEQRVLRRDRVLDVARGDLERGHAVRVHPDPHRLVGDAHHLRLAGARHALERVEHVDVRVVGDVLGAVAAFFREDGDQHHDRRGFLLHRHAELRHRRGELRRGEVDAVLHLHLRDVRVGVEREVDGEGELAGRGARRAHVEHVVDAVDLRLDRRGDRIGERLRVGARVGRLHGHLHRRDAGVLLHRQRGERDRAGEGDEDRDDGREDRPLDEEPREHGAGPATSSPPPAEAAWPVGPSVSNVERRARGELEPAVHHHPFARLQPLDDVPRVADPVADRHRPVLRLAVLVDHPDEVAARALQHRALRDEDRVRTGRAPDAHAHVLVRPQQSLRDCPRWRG